MKPTAARQKEHSRRQRNALQRAINRAIGLLKKNDPQVCIIVCSLIYLELFLPHIELLQGMFLNPITTPGYDLIVKTPMCIRQMEEKTYKNIDEFKRDVSGDYHSSAFILHDTNSHNITM